MRYACLLIVLWIVATATSAVAEVVFAYDVRRLGIKVGEGLVSVDRRPQGTVVGYRMNIDVTILGVNFYRLDSQQLAVFDTEERLIAARTKADIDGVKHDAEMKQNGNGLDVTYNGKEKRIEYSEFVDTTLDPVFGDASSGKWLDLTDTKLIPYQATKESDAILKLKRPDGDDTLELENGYLKRIESAISKGTLVMERVASGAQARSAVKLPDMVTLDADSVLANASGKKG